MGIVHHSNYLRFCEEARVEWCHSKNLIDANTDSVFNLTVYETQVRHVAPTRYGEKLTIDVQVKLVKAKVFFQYRLRVGDVVTALVKTMHCRLDKDFKVRRFDKKFVNSVEKEIWTETWL